MVDIILILLVIALLGAAIAYIVKEKKKGTVCIGCPLAGQCAKQRSGQGCSSEKQEQ